jgi:adenine deaminase
MPPVRAIRLATSHAAYRLGRNDLGLLAAGRRADVVVLDDLAGFAVGDVYASGVLVARDRALTVPCTEGPAVAPRNTMHLGAVAPDDFVLRLDPATTGEATGGTRLRVISGIVITEWGEAAVDVVDGAVVVPDGYLLQAVVHRHGRAEPVVRLALIDGWGSGWEGALATTVSHDTHNLVVLGRDPHDMAAAANAVIAAQGGVAVASHGKVEALVELPIAGILSDRPAPEVAAAQDHLLAVARRIGLPEGTMSQPLMQVMGVTLACLPGPHLTDVGLIDGTTGELLADAVLT